MLNELLSQAYFPPEQTDLSVGYVLGVVAGGVAIAIGLSRLDQRRRTREEEPRRRRYSEPDTQDDRRTQ